MDDDEKSTLMQSVHNELVGHHGINKTMDLLKAMGINFPKMKEYVTSYINACLICQKIKPSKDIVHGLSGLHLHGTYPMTELSCDTIGPLPPDQYGNSYILGIVDNFSKFIELFAIPSTQAMEYITSIVKHIGIFGVPKSIRTDGGTQFTANVCKDLSNMLKFDHMVIVPYHPEANGLIERRNAEVMKHLRALVFAKDVKDEWSKVLPLVQRILNYTKDGSLGVAPAQVLFGDMLPMNVSLDMDTKDDKIVLSDYLN
jgi:hypothetical protein